LGAALAMLPYIFRKNSNLKLLFQSGSRLKTVGIIFFGGLVGPLFLLAGSKTANAASVSIWLNMELVATAVLYVTSAQNIGANRSQILFSTAPIWGVVLSYLFVHEPFQWVHIISVVLLTLAVFITNLLSHNHLHNHLNVQHIHYHQHDDGHHDHLHEEDTVSERKWHSHLHTHNPTKHSHPHNPDLHHRHDHK
jgi:drug/metabolite transporter (DMT)-like permease